MSLNYHYHVGHCFQGVVSYTAYTTTNISNWDGLNVSVLTLTSYCILYDRVLVILLTSSIVFGHSYMNDQSNGSSHHLERRTPFH